MTQAAAPTSDIEWIAPPRDLADLVHSFFVHRLGRGRLENMMPAYSAQIFVFVEGSGEIHFPENGVGRSTGITLNAPMLSAAPLILEGPVLNVGASFTPLGWATFCGLPADEVHDRALDAATVIEPERLADLQEALIRCRNGTMSARNLCGVLEETIRNCAQDPVRPVKDDHRELLEAIEAWLASAFNPSVSALYESVELGQRQVQRVCRRYYGVPPAQLIKRYRAIRAAMLLAHDDLPAEYRDEVLGAYFDQAHLIHDIRRYTGRTPKRLLNEPLTQDLLDPDGHGRGGQKLRKS